MTPVTAAITIVRKTAVTQTTLVARFIAPYVQLERGEKRRRGGGDGGGGWYGVRRRGVGVGAVRCDAVQVVNVFGDEGVLLLALRWLFEKGEEEWRVGCTTFRGYDFERRLVGEPRKQRGAARRWWGVSGVMGVEQVLFCLGG